MSKIIYYVATSLDGYIAGPDDDVSAFPKGGKGVEKYLADLKEFKTVIMGRRTYEFGYQYGLEPGQPAYPHMEHYIFSDSLQLENIADAVHVESCSVDRIEEIKRDSDTDIYLCGGGTFAGWLLDNDLIDQLKLKLNPFILGNGIKLFGNSPKTVHWKLSQKESFEEGLQILTYDRWEK
ncbi:dihydrofolate reductase [Robertkochia marina]|uniref:Dihydrofolate reductase n=1 Tax=Robertkochia marina TaxID=1227945 RepID=A0A4S3LXW3_9FLAO|nr:dihydrofolate reductase family protein [Robertkochia marina]THD66266.1 dihydrofolate reductase [Robertkochia marina]TRZ40904.1 dihydrofolate reductase [Robertkochia marina]